MKTPRRALAYAPFVVGLALALGLAFPVRARAADAPWLPHAVPMRVMALGDSITAGVGANGTDLGSGGYRGELERLLDARRFSYAMIGGRSDYSAQLRMRGHEGHPGFVLRSFPSDPAPQLYGAVTRTAIKSYDPDVILLMAGTNDLLRLARHAGGYTVPNIVDSMDALLAQIFYEKPSVAVIVAGVVASPNVPMCAVERFDGAPADATCGPAESRNLRTLVAQYAARGFHVALAPQMENAVPRDRAHFPDGIHPSGPGAYESMARIWLAAIEAHSDGAPRETLAGR